MRVPISPNEKLIIELRVLAIGKNFDSLMYQFRVHRVMVSKFIPDLCNAIYQCLQIRSSVENWEKIANQTYKRWEFSIAFARADGKDITYFIHKEEPRFLHLNRILQFSVVGARWLWLPIYKCSLCEKCPNTELFLVRIFPHSEWIWRDTSYLSVFSPNSGKHGPEITPLAVKSVLAIRESTLTHYWKMLL